MDETNLGLMKRGITNKSQLSKVPKCAGIYLLKWQNGKFYIGKSKNVQNRFRQYLNQGHHTSYGKRLTNKYGFPEMSVLAFSDAHEHLTELENHYINLFFEDPDNINFCRAKHYRKDEYGPSELKGRYKSIVWATSSWTFAPVSFNGWSPIKNLLGIEYGGKIERRQIIFAESKDLLKLQYNKFQKLWIKRPHDYNNGYGLTWFWFEGECFLTAREAWEYSLLPVGLQYFQKHNYKTYYDYLHHSLQRSDVILFDGLKFHGGLHAYLYAKENIGISYDWFLIYYFKVGADSSAKINMILNRPRNRGPQKLRKLFVKHKKFSPCVSCYLVCHDGKRWYCSIDEAKRNNAKNLNFYYENEDRIKPISDCQEGDCSDDGSTGAPAEARPPALRRLDVYEPLAGRCEQMGRRHGGVRAEVRQATDGHILQHLDR